MGERGSALLEALIVTAIVGLIWAAATRVLTAVPAQAARWEEASTIRQRLRVIDARLARIVAGAGPIVLDVGGSLVRVPSIWPRRLGLVRAGVGGEVSPVAMTFLSRVDGHRVLTLTSVLGGSTAAVTAAPRPGCGSRAACGLRAGDTLLAVAPDGACGLYRVEGLGAVISLRALMQPGAAVFEPGAALIPIAIDAMSYDAEEGALRRYDGYRSDNVMVDGVSDLRVDWGVPGAGALGDGPFVGSGPLAFDVDQVPLRDVRIHVALRQGALAGPPTRASLAWRTRGWP